MAECGTCAGYYAHRRRAEPSCAACTSARRARQRRDYAAHADKRRAARRARYARLADAERAELISRNAGQRRARRKSDRVCPICEDTEWIRDTGGAAFETPRRIGLPESELLAHLRACGRRDLARWLTAPPRPRAARLADPAVSRALRRRLLGFPQRPSGPAP